MTAFLIACAVMVVAALSLVLVPLLREDRPNATAVPDAGRAVPAAVVLAVALPLGAAAFYVATSNFPWGDPAALVARPGHPAGEPSMEEVTAQLEERLASNPGDLEGWRMLGRLYLLLGRGAEAVAARERASALTGGRDPGIELDLAEALVLAGDPSAQAKAQQIVEAALAADEANPKALWYGGLMAQRSNDLATARARWSRLLETGPPEELRQILVEQLARLDAAAPAGQGGAEAAVRPAGRTLRIAVSVAPALLSRLKPGTLVFVSARESGIPGPPLAAVRLSSEQLPATVVLSDADAMIEGRNLSSADELQVVARVAFGGKVVTTSGDLLGAAVHRRGAPADLSIVIDSVAP